MRRRGPQNHKDDEYGDKEQEDSDWRKVETQKEKRKKMKEEEQRKKEQKKKEEKEKKNEEEEKKKKTEERKNEIKKKENPRHRRERSKGDALVIEAKDKTTYAVLLRKVREDLELKQLGEDVVKTRRTQKGEMLFELKKDSSVRSSAFKELVEKSLGKDANVKALSQESVVECKDLDEITTEDEVRCSLKVQCNLGDVPMTIRLRKAYGGTQTIYLLAIPRVTKQTERYFKCMNFGHQARNCKGPDRSELCRKCGEKGHVAKDCLKQPRCMLCRKEDGNGHKTGSFRFPAYKKAIAGQ
ncbi:uncharacterized protein LOC135709872 [Ochlerotatus camptorhynchus]|uniref:uncharacterized protein LOC135709872 n=1 Tax=Ochlerotatus camptorhynchus TaxID=644619 RepID=UPI0031D7C193